MRADGLEEGIRKVKQNLQALIGRGEDVQLWRLLLVFLLLFSVISVIAFAEELQTCSIFHHWIILESIFYSYFYYMLVSLLGIFLSADHRIPNEFFTELFLLSIYIYACINGREFEFTTKSQRNMKSGYKLQDFQRTPSSFNIYNTFKMFSPKMKFTRE